MLARADVVVRRGRLALLNRSLTQAQATAVDLLAIRAALDSSGIEHLLIRGNDNVPVIAVDHRLLERVKKALQEHLSDSPFYVRVTQPRKQTLLMADAGMDLADHHLTLRLFQPRVEPRGGLYFGAAAGISLEFWRHKKRRIKLPGENSLTRTELLRIELKLESVERDHQSWTTVESMFWPHAFDVPFPIDMVFSWVDGSSEGYQVQRRAAEQGAVLGKGDDHESRFRQVDELKYALRSIYMFAPWVRRIFIATDSPAPAWLAEHPRVRIVRSREHFADTSALPTYNSMAVETQLHHIEGLSEYFLYSNDDMFFGRPVDPGLFFSPGGVTRFMLSPNRIGLGANSPERSGFENAARVNRELLWDRFGILATRHLEHSAAPLRKSVMAELEAEFPAEFDATAASRFRAAENISVTNSLYHYYALLTGRAVMHKDARGVYVDTTSRKGLDSLAGILKRRNADFLCLNDGSTPGVPDEERRARVTDFLEKYFPLKAPWEK